MADIPKKKVDESWKDNVRKEAEHAPSQPAPAAPVPESEFIFFVSTLGMQALLALGELAHPVTGEKNTDFAQAKYLIDTLALLEVKTAGNLTEEEGAAMKGLLYELRMIFVDKTSKPV